MYKISIPVVVHDHFRKEETLAELRRAKADRVFLALSEIPFHPERRRERYRQLAELIPYYRAAGLEIGIWFWSFMRQDQENDPGHCQLRIRMDGTEMPATYCPFSPDFIADTQDFLTEVAKLGPDILQFDDDYGISYAGSSRCYCPLHMQRYREILGEDIDRQTLYEKAFSGKPNRYRDALLQASGESMDNFSRKMREAVDKVNPNIRISVCSVFTSWDRDGTNAIRTAKLLAGQTKPILRLIAAPYWAVHVSWGNRLQHIVELSRIQAQWCEGQDIEVVSEGDVFPRPRHRVPAAYLEGFDTAMRFAGGTDGILKYMLDYVSSPGYETGYIDFHVRNESLYQSIQSAVEGKAAQGVRVYDAMEKYAQADMTGVKDPFYYGVNMFFSVGARLLTDNSIPTTYEGSGCCGIAFGENARHLPKEALDKGLILDIRAAGILMEQGVDVGIETISGTVQEQRTASGCESHQYLYYPEYDEYTPQSYAKGAYVFTPKKEAKVITARREGSQDTPDTILYTNAAGQRFLVYGFDAHFVCEDRYRSYAVQRQLLEVIPWLGGSQLPVQCTGNPDLYFQCRADEKETAVGMWNFFPDPVIRPVVQLDGQYSHIRFIAGSGTLEGDRVILDPIASFGFAGFVLEKD